jgi:hypothetical protein
MRTETVPARAAHRGRLCQNCRLVGTGGGGQPAEVLHSRYEVGRLAAISFGIGGRFGSGSG